MNVLIFLAALADRLDPALGGMLDHFRDEHVPLQLSIMIFAAAAVLLVVLVTWGAVAWARIQRLRRLVRSSGQATLFRENFARVDEGLVASMFGDAWAEYRECLKQTETGILYPRRPDEYLGLHAIAARDFPARFFAAAHGYFIGIGLLLTFVGLVAALRFAAAGVASHDIAVVKDALNALLSAASFKFMTSIAGLGCSLILSMAARSTSYLVESAAQGLAGDLERAMSPIFTECLAFDQLAATRAQLAQLKKIGTSLAMPMAAPAPALATNAAQFEGLQHMLTRFLTDMRSASGSEMKQVTTKLSDVGDAIGQMQSHIDKSGLQFADQLSLAASRLLAAATALQDNLDARVDQVGARMDAMANTFSHGEALLSGAAEKAATGMLVGFEAFDASLRSQVGSMHEIVGALDRARHVLDASAATWMTSAAPIVASVDASRQITAELGEVAATVGGAQRDMAEMSKAISQLSEKTGAVWDSYRSRFEKVDDDLQAVFERLQGGTRAFGEEFMDLVTRLDSSLANGMEAFSLGTEELREVAEVLAARVQANAA